ncbi:hypothetical protein [Lacihabitans lacunae]|uniref:Uncharacterized protein n=1 Tax=Lacihabitans lacunae TaxID=1028214 RepID=A0ABV7YYF0_9BACT
MQIWKSSIETNYNKLAYSLALGVTESNTISVGTSISSLAYTLEGLEMVIGQSLARILGFSISASVTAISTIPFLVTSDQNKDYGAGVLEPYLLAVKLPVVVPVNISIDIDHALPTGINGNCIVYVIWGPNFEHYKNPPHPIEVAKYGMTC